MSIQETNLAAIADAIREKEGSTGPIPAKTFADRIRAIPSGGGLPDDVYTINLTSSAPEGGTVEGGGVASGGMTVTVKAVPDGTCYFDGWMENGELVSEDSEYSFIVASNRALTAMFEDSKGQRLPEGYTEVKYIDSSGGAYINTGVKPTSTIKLTMDVMPLEAATSTTKYFLGSRDVSSSTKYYFFLIWSTNGVRVATHTTNGSVAYNTLSTDTILRRMIATIDCANKKAYIDKEPDVTLTISFSSSMSSIALFRGSTTSGAIDARLYSCQIEKAASLVLDFVPCIDPSGAVGLYDLVEGQFYGNAGTGAFTAGPAV